LIILVVFDAYTHVTVTAKTTCDVLDEDRDEYDNLLERLWRITRDLDKKLPLFLMSIADSNKQEDILRKFLPTVRGIPENFYVASSDKIYRSRPLSTNVMSS
jgi:hypothetical protein